MEVERIRELGGEPTECPTCGQMGFPNIRDDRGLLIVHPGRRWQCRVSSEVLEGAPS